jgi:ParB/RepB/Spo0J family partition protein
MRRQSNTDNQANSHQAATILRTIPLPEIARPASNTRQTIARKGITELAGSIRQHGVLQPILVSEITPDKVGQAKYQIIAGERRYLAAEQAGLKEIPALVKALSDEAALGAQIVENLQREEVHPLDEADGFLRLKEEMKLDLSTIAQRVGKDARYVARRLALTTLIDEAREDLRKERITLAHALEICRLAPEIQPQALSACYEPKSVWDGEEGDNNSPPADKTRPARHVRYLQEWIARNVHLNLKNAPFSLDDARLREDELTCLNCPQRSGFNKALFADIKDGDTCLNPLCFQGKLQQFVQLRKTELEEKHHKPVVFISAYYGRNTQDSSVISRDQYQLLEKKADRCEFAEPAILADGNNIGQTKWICREQTCKDHLGRVTDFRSHSSGSSSRTAAPGGHGLRRQELFDLKVDEAVRKRVMQEAVKTFAWPLERGHLNEVAKEFFRRIPSDDQQTICEVFGWNEELASRLRYDDAAVLGELAQLDDHRLGQFLMLCSVAHYGANPQRRRPVDQGAVVMLSQERGVNHGLIDAEVRLELCPKKYKARHQQYVAAVKAGKVADKPLVCERPQPAVSSERSEATAQKAA